MNKSIIWRDEALAAIATSFSPSAERAKEVIMDAQLAVMGLPEADIHEELDRVYRLGRAEMEMSLADKMFHWHPYPEERPVKGENDGYYGDYLIWTETGFCSTIEYHYGKGKWNVCDNNEDNEFKDVIAWAEIVPYRRQSDD